jgi:hypothetical protein
MSRSKNRKTKGTVMRIVLNISSSSSATGAGLAFSSIGSLPVAVGFEDRSTSGVELGLGRAEG